MLEASFQISYIKRANLINDSNKFRLTLFIIILLRKYFKIYTYYNLYYYYKKILPSSFVKNKGIDLKHSINEWTRPCNMSELFDISIIHFKPENEHFII